MAGGSRRAASGAASGSGRRGRGRGRGRGRTTAAATIPDDREEAAPPWMEDEVMVDVGGAGDMVVAPPCAEAEEAEAAEAGAAVAVASSSSSSTAAPPSSPPAQAFALTAAPMYPNSVRWSHDNLIAVAAGHMVTILNPASLSGPRSFVSVSARSLIDFGTVSREELRSHLLMPLTLSRGSRAVVRCIDWSCQGVAANGGCLLAVGTTDYRVKLYSSPLSEYRSEWVEVIDLSELMLQYCMKWDFLEGDSDIDSQSGRVRKRQAPEQLSSLEDKRRKVHANGMTHGPLLHLEPGSSIITTPEAWDSNHSSLMDDVYSESYDKREKRPEMQDFPAESNKQNKRKKLQKFRDGSNTGVVISAAQYMSRSAMLTPLVLSWSPKIETNPSQKHVVLAVGTKAGMVGFWRLAYPRCYAVEKVPQSPNACFLGFMQAHDAWVTVLDWAKLHQESSGELILASGSSDGSVKLWVADSKALMSWEPSCGLLPWTLLMQVTSHDAIPVTCMSLKVPYEASRVLLAVGKGSGSILAWDCTRSGTCTAKASSAAHDQAVMGLCWTIDEAFIYSCGQDNLMQMWKFAPNELTRVESSLLSSEVPATAPDLPASALESFYGVARSPADLALVMVRGISAEVVDPMYQSRSQKGVVQLIWVGGPDDVKFDSLLHTRSTYAISTSWKPRITAALQYLEQHAQTVVLWDVLTVLAFLKSVCGIETLGSILQSWLSKWKFVNSEHADVCCWPTSDLRASLSSMGCRLLQMIVVIFRRIILQELRPSLNSDGLEALLNSVSRTQLTQEQQIWLDSLWCLELELRERLMLLGLVTALWWKSPQAEHIKPSEEMESRISTAMLMSDWILLNTSKVNPPLMQLASEVRKVYKRDSPSLERCSFCEQPVPLEYLEVGYCRGVSSSGSSSSGSGSGSHRLQRCSASLRVCPAERCCWSCSSCSRCAWQQPPELFFGLGSRLQIERLPSAAGMHQTVVPYCPFCGILMHASLPDFFLTPSLV